MSSDNWIHPDKAFLLVVLDELRRTGPFEGKEQLTMDITAVLDEWLHLDSGIGDRLDGEWIGSADEGFIHENIWAVM